MGLKGSLDELPLADLIEMTSLGGKTGRLMLFHEEGAVAGELTFREGRLAGAVCGALVAEKAFYALLALKEGTFDFDATAELGDETCNLPTASLLMEGMRRLDELRRLRDELPATARVRVRGGEAQDEIEARVLRHRGRRARALGKIVSGLLVGGDADEYDALRTLQGLASRGVIHVEIPRGVSRAKQDDQDEPPQPELER
ncbi:MAG: DUF4388 domain-containing protein [Actinobacteria bacterium]|nr:DUF4388 domain-containing protein [Actinomycetota bacterium]